MPRSTAVDPLEDDAPDGPNPEMAGGDLPRPLISDRVDEKARTLLNPGWCFFFFWPCHSVGCRTKGKRKEKRET